MKQDFGSAQIADDIELDAETAEFMSAETEFAEEAAQIMEALSYCLECIFRGQDRLPEEIEESVPAEMRDHALDITDQITTTHNPSREEFDRYHYFNDTHPNVAWPYALIDVIAADLELPADWGWRDTVSQHGYFEKIDAEQAKNMSPPNVHTQALLSQTLAEELDGFMRAAAKVIGQHLGMETVIPTLVTAAYEDAQEHYEEHGMHITEIDIETWLPNFYSDVLEEHGMTQALEIYGIQVH